MMDPLVAHATHWYWFPLYLAPVVIILYSAIATTLRERRASREEDAASGKRGDSSG
jgi:hypothetical protein